MLLTISTTHQAVSDLRYLLHKNPARLQTEDLSFGTVTAFYPEASAEKCTVVPQVLTAGDEIRLPVNVRNYTSHALTLSVIVKPAEWFTLTPPAATTQQVAAIRDVLPAPISQFYSLTLAGRRQLRIETEKWSRMTDAVNSILVATTEQI